MLKKLLGWVLLGGLICEGCSAADTSGMDAAHVAVPDAGVAAVRQALLTYAPRLQIDTISPAPLPGYYQVIAAGQMAFVSADGRYMLHGSLVDMKNHQQLSDDAWARFRKAELDKIPQADRIVFAPAHPKYKVTVFTDVNCGYCRAFHKQIDAYNRAGIEVDYLAWPREGVQDTAGKNTPTYDEMVSVWCAADRKTAFTDAKQDKPPSPATCNNPVKNEFEVGERLGVNGTPTIVAADGSVVGGYLPPDRLLKVLQNPGANRIPQQD